MRLVTLLVCLLAATPASSQVLWRLDTRASVVPLAGAMETEGDQELGRVVDRLYVPGAGPSGEPVYRFRFRYDASQMNAANAYGGEHYLGWSNTNLAPVGGAPSRFGRIRFRVSSDSNFRAINSANGGASQIIHKIAIVADGNPTRTIVSIHGDVASGTFQLQVGRNGEGNLKVDGLQRGVWYALQWETLFGSGPSLRVWLNNNAQASPTRAVSGLNFNPAGYNWFFLGFYNNRMIAANGVYVVDIAAAEYAGSFDPAWDQTGIPIEIPAAPANLRVRVGGG